MRLIEDFWITVIVFVAAIRRYQGFLCSAYELSYLEEVRCKLASSRQLAKILALCQNS